MNRGSGIGPLAAVLAAGALMFAACGGPAAEQGSGRGVVRDVDVAEREVTIDHGDIPGVMKAMTMTFSVAEPVELEVVEPGTRVDFEVELTEGRYVVTRIQPAGP